MVEIGSSTNSVSREQYKQQIAALRQERAKTDASARRWDIATKIDTAVAVIALAPLTLLTGCPTAPQNPAQPPYIPPVANDPDPIETPTEGEGETPAEGEGDDPVIENGFAMKDFKMIVPEGQRDVNDTDPGGNVGPIQVGGTSGGITALGYTNRYWTVKNFNGETSYNDIQIANIRPEDQADVAWGTCGKNGNVDADGNLVPEGLQPADVTGKSVAIINVASSTVLYPGDYVTFPTILVKGNTINEESGVNYSKYLTTTSDMVDTNANGVHDELEMYYPTGLSIAFRRSGADKRIALYTYAGNDPLTAVPGGTGKVTDPRLATAAFWAYSNDETSIPRMMWGNRYPGEAAAVMFNSFPLIDLSETPEAKLAFVTGTTGASLPEEAAGFGYDVAGVAEADIPDDAKMYYNTDRNTVDGIDGRSEAGRVLLTKDEISRQLGGVAHVEMMMKFPEEGVGVPQEVVDNGASMPVRFTSTEYPVSANTEALKANPALAYKP